MRSWPLLAVSVVVAGCGGGGGSTDSASGGGEFQFGALSGRAASTNPPITTNSQQTTATGFTGAITALRFRDQNVSWEDCRIVFSDKRSGTYQVYIMDADGSNVQQLTKNAFDCVATHVSADGKRIAYIAYPSGSEEIYTMNIDGTSQTRRTNNAFIDTAATFSPDGSELAFASNRDGNYELYRMNLTTAAVTRVTNTPTHAEVWPNYTSDGQWLVFVSDKYQGTSNTDLFRVRINGTEYTDVHVAPGYVGVPSVSQDNIAYYGVDSNICRHSVFGQDVHFLEVTSSTLEDAPRLSPDGKKLLYIERDNGLDAVMLGSPTGPLNGTPVSVGNERFIASWVPAQKDRTFIGSGGTFGSTGAGMIFSQQGLELKAVVGFGATTQSTVVMTQQSGQNTTGPNLVYSIDADTITYISYVNGPQFRTVKVVGAGLGVPQCDGALISIDSASGQVAAILPFDGSRGVSRSMKDEGNVRVFTGSFLGVFDGTGKNVAQGGATEVRLDMTTGAITTR